MQRLGLGGAFAQNDIIFYDPCGGNSAGNRIAIVSGGCAKLGELRTAMWNAASEDDKRNLMYVVSQENDSLAGVEGYMNQVIARYNDDIDNYVIHEISQKGDYTIILIISILPDNYADSSLMVAQKDENSYSVLYNGQIYTRDVLKDAGVPDNVIDEIFNKEKLIMNIPTIEITAIDAVDRKNALTVIRELCECELGEYDLRYNNYTNPFTGGNR